jgi:phage host-nuclease inhibitor protein Gam
MKQDANGAKKSVIIGRDANGANIEINVNELNTVISKQIDLKQIQNNIKRLAHEIDKQQHQLNTHIDKQKSENNNQKDKDEYQLKIRIPIIDRLKKRYTIILIFIVVLFAISVLALCMSLQLLSIGTMEFVSGTIAILSILVVTLMSWQIFNVLDLKDHIKKIETIEKYIGKLERWLDEINIIKDDIKKLCDNNQLALSEIYKTRGLAYENVCLSKSIICYFKAIGFALDISFEDYARPYAQSILIQLSAYLDTKDINEVKSIFLNDNVLSEVQKVKTNHNYILIQLDFCDFLEKFA